jgi:hypothetical protein
MKFLINVKTFLRADDAMLNLLLPHVSCGYPVKGHWAVWLIPTNKVPDEVKTWLQHQPVDVYDTCRYIGFVDGLKSCEVNDPTYTTHLAIGVSLSALDREQIQRLIRGKGSLSIVEADVSRPGFDVTKNPNLFTQGSTGFLYTSRYKAELTLAPKEESSSDLAKKFLDSLEGHDFWYDYSDSLSVYKAGKARAEALKRAGCEMGLTGAEVERLYNQKYKELMKR